MFISTAVRPPMIPSALLNYLLVLVVGIVMGAVAGAAINGWRLNSQMATAAAAHAEQITGIVQAASAAASDALERQRAAQASLSQIDHQYTQELANAHAESDRLRSAVAAGQRQLRIQATCTDSGADRVRGATATSSMDDGPRARLTDTAERDYWRLRDRITTITAQVAGLQAYVVQACLR